MMSDTHLPWKRYVSPIDAGSSADIRKALEQYAQSRGIYKRPDWRQEAILMLEAEFLEEGKREGSQTLSHLVRKCHLNSFFKKYDPPKGHDSRWSWTFVNKVCFTETPRCNGLLADRPKVGQSPDAQLDLDGYLDIMYKEHSAFNTSNNLKIAIVHNARPYCELHHYWKNVKTYVCHLPGGGAEITKDNLADWAKVYMQSDYMIVFIGNGARRYLLELLFGLCKVIKWGDTESIPSASTETVMSRNLTAWTAALHKQLVSMTSSGSHDFNDMTEVLDVCEMKVMDMLQNVHKQPIRNPEVRMYMPAIKDASDDDMHAMIEKQNFVRRFLKEKCAGASTLNWNADRLVPLFNSMMERMTHFNISKKMGPSEMIKTVGSAFNEMLFWCVQMKHFMDTGTDTETNLNYSLFITKYPLLGRGDCMAVDEIVPIHVVMSNLTNAETRKRIEALTSKGHEAVYSDEHEGAKAAVEDYPSWGEFPSDLPTVIQSDVDYIRRNDKWSLRQRDDGPDFTTIVESPKQLERAGPVVDDAQNTVTTIHSCEMEELFERTTLRQIEMERGVPPVAYIPRNPDCKMKEMFAKRRTGPTPIGRVVGNGIATAFAIRNDKGQTQFITPFHALGEQTLLQWEGNSSIHATVLDINVDTDTAFLHPEHLPSGLGTLKLRQAAARKPTEVWYLNNFGETMVEQIGEFDFHNPLPLMNYHRGMSGSIIVQDDSIVGYIIAKHRRLPQYLASVWNGTAFVNMLRSYHPADKDQYYLCSDTPEKTFDLSHMIMNSAMNYHRTNELPGILNKLDQRWLEFRTFMARWMNEPKEELQESLAVEIKDLSTMAKYVDTYKVEAGSPFASRRWAIEHLEAGEDVCRKLNIVYKRAAEEFREIMGYNIKGGRVQNVLEINASKSPTRYDGISLPAVITKMITTMQLKGGMDPKAFKREDKTGLQAVKSKQIH